jgi:ABC-type transport system involved in multi-copper enzyme maturation permease subunit
MKAVWRIARTEVLEHRRQPAMVLILALNYVVLIAAFAAFFLLLDAAAQQPDAMATLRAQLRTFGVELDAFLRLAVSTFGSLMFTNLPLFVAILSGTSVLHDRECGTMPFLMLAPITRRELLLGKLMGAMAIPLLFHVVFVGMGSLALGRVALLAPFADRFGGSAAWWVALLCGAPASAALVGALGTVVSALSRDVRTSMQYTSFFIGLLSLGIGFVLVDAVAEGVLLQLGFAIACMAMAGLALLGGAALIREDFASW